MTVNLSIVDEAGFSNEALKVILPFTIEAQSKVINLSSANSGEEKSCLLNRLRTITDYPLYIVSLMCGRHAPKVIDNPNATVCPCFVLSTPPARTADLALKNTMNALFPNSFIEEIAGGGSDPNSATVSTCLFRNLNEFDLERISTTTRYKDLENTVVVYIDPAYNSSSNASSTGITFATTIFDKIVILAIEEYKVPQQSTDVAHEIGMLCVTTSHEIQVAHMCHFQRFVFVIESNYASCYVFNIAQIINEKLRERLRKSVKIEFFHHLSTDGSLHIGYNLGAEKRDVFESFIKLFNDRLIRLSTTVFSSASGGEETVITLIEQLKTVTRKVTESRNVTYSGKGHKKRDDVVLSCILCIYFVLKLHEINTIGKFILPMRHGI